MRLRASIRGLVKSRDGARARGGARVAAGSAANGAGAPVLNQALLEAYLKAFPGGRGRAMAWTREPDLNAALRVPGMFAAAEEAEPGREPEARC